MLSNEDTISSIPRITPQWLAGFFDGEGYVCTQNTDGWLRVRVGITQKDPRILTLIMLKYNEGNINYHKRSDCHNLIFCGKNSLRMLNDILPFCVVKLRLVEKAVELIQTGSQTRKLELREEILNINKKVINATNLA